MDEKILEIMSRVLKIPGITFDATQKNCENWDSMRHLNLIVELEDEFDVEFEPEEIAEMKSFEAIKDFLENKL